MRTSLVIATFERADLLETALARLALLTPPDEVIVVDDGSESGDTAGVCARAMDELPLTYIRHDNPGWTTPCAARNMGVRAARGDHIVTSEPEIVFESDVIPQLEAARADDRRHVLHESVCAHQEEDGSWKEVPGFYVHSFSKRWLNVVGGWDEGFPESWGWDDIDLYKRLEYIGHSRRGLPELRVSHLWHPSRINEARLNERHAMDKVMPRDLVANR